MDHLEPLELDAVRAGEASPEHLKACAECRQAVEQLLRVADRLRRHAAIGVPTEIDRLILHRARRGRFFRPLWFSAAAALLLVAIMFAVRTRHPLDVDGDGRVDVVDAYVMAKEGRDPGPAIRASVSTTMLAIFFAAQEEVRFRAVDVFVDSGDVPLAAWQVEVTARAKIVGVEGGKEPPHYDPAALHGGRIVLAAFTKEVTPPAGRVLVARLHMWETGRPEYAVRLIAAAAPGGRRIDAKAEIAGGEK